MSEQPPPVERSAPVPDLSLLSRRELEVLDAALEGLSARAIASRFSLTEATVRSHLSAIYSKLGVAGRVELLARLNGKAADMPATIEPSLPEPPAESPASRTPGRSHRTRRFAPGFVAVVACGLVAVIVCGLVVGAAGFLVIGVSSPRETDLATVSRLLASNDVAQLDLVNSTLTVTETNGERLRVEGVALGAFQPLQVVALNASIPVSVSGGTAPPPWIEMLINAGPLLEVALLLGVFILLFRAIRRPPRLRPTG
jgi:DNA-binding CsgD family transcriptional regulator